MLTKEGIVTAAACFPGHVRSGELGAGSWGLEAPRIGIKGKKVATISNKQ